MKIDNRTNINFKANFLTIKPEDASRQIIKKITPYFKDCGSDFVTHELKTNDIDNMSALVLTTYRAGKNISFQTIKHLDLKDTDSILKKVKELKIWIEDRRIQAGL